MKTLFGIFLAAAMGVSAATQALTIRANPKDISCEITGGVAIFYKGQVIAHPDLPANLNSFAVKAYCEGILDQARTANTTANSPYSGYVLINPSLDWTYGVLQNEVKPTCQK